MNRKTRTPTCQSRLGLSTVLALALMSGCGAANAVSEQAWYDNTRLLSRAQNGEYSDTLWLGEIPLAEAGSGTLTYIHTNHIRRPVAGSDAGGIVTTYQGQAPFGTRAAVEGTMQLPGQYADSDSGLSYNLNRYYDPDSGRYLRPDPMGLNGGSNHYGYAGASPVGKIDPTGLAAYEVGVTPWPGGGVPYKYDPGVPQAKRDYIRSKMDYIEQATGGAVHFYPGNGHPDSVTISTDPAVMNVASYGYDPARRGQPGDRVNQTGNFLNIGYLPAHPFALQMIQTVHELGHVLGLVHEHQRPDRCAHIWGPDAGALSYADKPIDTRFPYDLMSVMHYQSSPGYGSEYVINPDRYRGVTSADVGFKTQLSWMDIETIRFLYGKPSAYGNYPSFNAWRTTPEGCGCR